MRRSYETDKHSRITSTSLLLKPGISCYTVDVHEGRRCAKLYRGGGGENARILCTSFIDSPSDNLWQYWDRCHCCQSIKVTSETLTASANSGLLTHPRSPWSQPLITCPVPRVNTKGCPRGTLLSNSVPSWSVPWTDIGTHTSIPDSWVSLATYQLQGGSVTEWLACWTQAQKGPGSNRSHDAVG